MTGYAQERSAMGELWQPLSLSLQIATIATLLTIVLVTPLAYAMSRRGFPGRSALEVLILLPLVLPPTVMGFYLLILLGPAGPIGGWWVSLTGDTLTFSFAGLVIASCLHSLPFAVQPLQNAFEAVGRDRLEAAASLRASPLDAFTR